MIEDTYFIDRNGEIFSEILDFFRDLNEFELPSDSDKLKRLLTEAKYYSIVPLIQKIQERLEHQKEVFQVTVTSFGHGCDKDFDDYCYSENAPQIVKDHIERCVSKKERTIFSEIIEVAEDCGYRLIQLKACSENRRDSQGCLIFRGC